MREALLKNQIIKLVLTTDAQHTRDFKIQEKLGEGANCIAYRAIDVGSQLPVVVKECFPLGIVGRERDGTAVWNTP